MIEKIRAMKNKKGFTLVELIVVLVILAILAALLVPALTGYIDKANKQKVTAECRMVVMAAQTEASEQYGALDSTASDKAKTIAEKLTGDATKPCQAIADLSEVTGKFEIQVDDAGKVQVVKYTNDGFTCTYTADGSSYDVKKADKDNTISANKAETYTKTPASGN